MTIPELTPSEVARFYSKLRFEGCGLRWPGPFNNHGYGRFAIYRNNKTIRILAHRLAYKLFTGEDPGQSVVRHDCDTPACCTPDCLRTGTQADNLRDAMERQRVNLSGLASFHESRTQNIRARIERGEKRCYACKLTKPLVDFQRASSSPDGRRYACRDCERTSKRRRRQRAGLDEEQRANQRRRDQRAALTAARRADRVAL